MLERFVRKKAKGKVGQPRLALVLGGGGARGVAHLGVLAVLEKHGVSPELLVGTSAGSLAAAAYALDPDARALAERGLGYLQGEDFKRLGLKREEPLDAGQASFIGAVWNYLKRGIAFSLLLRRNAVYPGEVLETIVAAMVPDKSFADTRIPLAIPVLDLRSGEEVVLTAGSLREAVVASCSLPGFFPPRPMGERLFADPGPVGSVPADVARKLGADIVIAVDIELPFARGLDDAALASGLDIMFRVEAVASRRLKLAQCEKADVLIRPEFEQETWTDFEKLGDYVEKGRKAAEEKLEEILKATSSK